MGRETYLIGVDLGTMGTRAGVFDCSGRLAGETFEDSVLSCPRPGWVEQDLEQMYGSCLSTIRAAVERAAIDPRDVAAIAVDGQMAGIGGVGADGLASMRYDSWLDTRCEPYIDLMNREAGELVLRMSGSPPTYDHGPKILWWMREEPETFKATAKFVVPSAYAAMRMAGLRGEDAFIDHTQLHFSGFGDVEGMRWSAETCSAFGLPMDKLPRIVAPWEIIGRLTPEAAARSGLMPGVAIAAGAGDQAATSLGAGVVSPGQVFDVAGTASVFSVCVDRRVLDVKYRTFLSARSVIPGLWVPIAYVNGGGLCLRWFRDEIASGVVLGAAGQQEKAYALLDEMARGIAPGSDGLVFVPHFAGRVTPNDPSVRGAWLGLSWGHKLGHLYRAILEGIAYEYKCYMDVLRDLVPSMEFTEARVIGGGARSIVWNQIKSNVLALPYAQLDRGEVAVWGSALIAGRAVGVYSDLAETARASTKTIARFVPDVGAHRRYQPYVQAYRSLLDGLAPAFRNLRDATAQEAG